MPEEEISRLRSAAHPPGSSARDEISRQGGKLFRVLDARARRCDHRAPLVGDRPLRSRRPLVAGWSSLVARWAHNPKVAGSNPAPATNRIQLNPLETEGFRLLG